MNTAFEGKEEGEEEEEEREGSTGPSGRREKAKDDRESRKTSASAAADHLKWWSDSKALYFILIVFQWLVTFTPSEAYLVPFLTRVKPFTSKQVEIDIFPCGVYATLVFTLLAAPACRLFTHRGVIIMGTFSKLLTFTVIYYAESLPLMQLSQVTYGFGVASNLVFSSYIFILFAEEDYQKMTSHTQASSLISFLMAAELGQSLVKGGVSLVVLLQITRVFMILSCAVSFILPKRMSEVQESRLFSLGDGTTGGLLETIKQTWQGSNLRLFSFWWVFGTAGLTMILNYGTNLFNEIDPESNSYGYMVAASQGAGFLGALASVHVAPLMARPRRGGFVYFAGTFSAGLLCIIMSWSNNLWIAYPAYIAAIGIYQFLQCLIYVQTAKSLSNREFILLFSLNTVAALLVQSAIQVAVEVFGLTMVYQFYVYGGYCMVLAVTFLLLCHYNYLKSGTVEPGPSGDGYTLL